MAVSVKNILRNLLGLVLGFVGGSIANMLTISALNSFISPPEGVNINDIHSIRQHMHLYEFKHLLAPLIGHAFGTFVGAFIAVKIAAAKAHWAWPMAIGALFLLGGIWMVVMIPETPLWFMVSDWLLAYFPMAWLAYRLGKKNV